MVLKSNSFEILNQLADLLEQLTNQEYSQELPLLSNNSLGKHVRHVLEFYIELTKGIETGVIDYDLRKRDEFLETSIAVAIDKINMINAVIMNAKENIPIRLQVCLSMEKENVSIETSFSRELAYNIEHAIHHFAILKIAVDSYFPEVSLPSNFGIAYSTVKHQQTVCAQ
jgi:hypothetical protein